MHHHEHFWWKYIPKKEMTEIYISIAIRAFAFSLLSLFVPLYLYSELGYSLNATLGFFLVYSVVFAVMTPIAAKIMARIGVKHTMLLSVPMYITYFMLLYGLKSYPIPLYLVSVFFGLGHALFWIAFHIEFTKFSDGHRRGEEVGKRRAIGLAAGLA
ncbi:MFS transporter, partial [Candidatus Woesearchaeota archaeon]|nr:MFS transporter [Candidatus Woesearchaeota archaeon]